MQLQPFDLIAAVTEEVLRLGGRPGDWHTLMLDTLAGPLGITPYPTWIATRFEDVARAREAPLSGALNPYSGKWNWHYGDRPQREDLERFLAELRRLVPGASTPARRGPGPQAGAAP